MLALNILPGITFKLHISFQALSEPTYVVFRGTFSLNSLPAIAVIGSVLVSFRTCTLKSGFW